MAEKLIPYIEQNNEIYQVYDIEAHNAINNINTTINETVTESNKEINKILKYDSFNTINYGYGTEIQETIADPTVTNSSTMLGYKRDGMFITLNGRHNVYYSSYNRNIYLRLNGAVARAVLPSGVKGWTNEEYTLKLKPSTKYKVTLYLLSDNVEDMDYLNIRMCQSGVESSLGILEKTTNKQERFFQTTDDETTTYNLILYIPYNAEHVFENTQLCITLEEDPETENILDTNYIVKYGPINTINYNYNYQKRPPSSTATDTTMLGYRRDGMFITLNGKHNVISSGQRSIKIKLNGSVATTFSNSTIDSWTTDSLQLKPNTQYKASLYDLSGVEGFEDLSIMFYQAGSHTSLGTKKTFNNKIEKIFTTGADDTITYNLVLFIPYHETHVFINNSFYITLEEYEDPIDTTLTKSNIAADAATVGAKLAALETRIAALENAT